MHPTNHDFGDAQTNNCTAILVARAVQALARPWEATRQATKKQAATSCNIVDMKSTNAMQSFAFAIIIGLSMVISRT
jgi:hypothetical protein